MKTKTQNRLLIATITFSLLYFFVIYCLAAMPAQFWLRLTPNLNDAIHLSNNVFIISHIAVAICGIFLFRSVLKIDWTWIKQHIGKTILSIIIGMIAIIISGMLFIQGTSDNEVNLQFMMDSMSRLQLILFQIVVIFIGPLNEELMFREVLIGQCSKALPKYVMWVISSLLFAAIHIPNLAAWPQGIPYFVNGLIIGFVYIRCNNNVLCSYGLHLVNNLLSLII